MNAFQLNLVTGLLAATATAGSAADGEWTEFRGPGGQGHAASEKLPLNWSPNKNVVWKQAILGVGWSSPIVSKGQIFLSSGIPDNNGGPSLHALALDEATGKILWDKELFTPAETKPRPMHNKNSQASPTPIIEGDRIYFHFGHHGAACLDRSGKLLWRNNSFGYEAVHGNGSSPILVDDKLIFSADGASNPFVAALDKNTGKQLWKFQRPNVPVSLKFSFCTPLLITVDGKKQIITPGSGAVWALDPKDGRELWRVRYAQGYSVVPRPVFAHGLLFVSTGFNRADLLAIKPGGEGDLTDTNIVWRTTKGAPTTPSMVVVGEEIYAVGDTGLASCWDAKTGKVHWQEQLEGGYSSSIVAAPGRLYLQNETGLGVVLATGKEFKKLATNPLEEKTLSSYAVDGDSLFIRSEKNLYRIREK